LNEFVEDDRGLVGFGVSRKVQGSDERVEEIYYTEELIAMILKAGRTFAEKQCGSIIKDSVITIPSYFTPTQKRMMIDAAELAGLSVLQLIHENTAVATMYGIDRLDSEAPHTVLFYNMGGIDTEVSLVRYSTITDVVTNKSYEHIEILAEAYDKNLGGYDLDIVLVNMLADEFNALKERKGKPDVRTYPRTLKRLLKEVTKIKDVLSANKQMQVKLAEL
jgi:hypoxia up-regulated 1